MLRAVAPSLGCRTDEFTVSLVEGGRSNLTYRLTAGDRHWILRRPPLGHVLATAHNMSREYRVMSALATAGVCVPTTVVNVDDPERHGTAFYVMELIDGITVHSPADGRLLSPAQAARAADDLVVQLVGVHQVDVGRAGLENFGRPAGYLRRQISRWEEQWRSSVTAADRAPVPLVASELAAGIPVAERATVVHGDYRLDNTILRRDDPGRVAAIIDWEMSTLGDPISDLGLLLAYWTPLGARVAGTVAAAGLNPGFPPGDALAARYESLSAFVLPDLGFYLAFAYFKLAVIAQTILARYRQGLTVGLDVGASGEVVNELVDTARYILGGRERAL